MTRPLRYDDSFKNILQEKIHDKFLYLFNVKVQSTAFCQKLNLQRSLIITSAFDVLIGIIIIFVFFNNIEREETFLYFIENFILISGICFGMVGFDCANNLRKSNMRIYKNWRLFVTFSILLLEIINNFDILCEIFSSEKCNNISNVLMLIIYFIVNVYFSKIAWSFYIRLIRGHELLVIHGKYLERMMNEESYKLKDLKQYVPKMV